MGAVHPNVTNYNYNHTDNQTGVSSNRYNNKYSGLLQMIITISIAWKGGNRY